MCDVTSTDGSANPARLGAVLAIGILSGMTCAIVLLIQGGGWLLALAAYSGTGVAATAAAGALKVLTCRFYKAPIEALAVVRA